MLARTATAVLLAITAGAQSPPSVGALTRQLRDGDPAKRAAAVRGLADVAAKSNPARKALASALADDEPAVRTRAAEALAACGKQALKLLADALEEPEAQLGAFEAIGKLGPPALPLLPDIMKQWPRLDGKYELELAAAVVAMGPKAVPPLAKALDSHGECAYAARVLQHFGPAAKDAVPQLIKQLAHRGKRGQSDVAAALGRIGDERAIPPLIDFATVRIDTAGDEGNCTAALRSLERFGKRAAAAVPLGLRALQLAPTKANESLRRDAAQLLGEAGSATPELRAALQKAAAEDPSTDVQEAARAALKRL